MKPSTITGFLIRYHRLKQNISQEGLCKGICVVSYLSKIEQGVVCASDEIIHQLFHALKLTYHDEADFLAQAKQTLYDYFEKHFMQEENIQEAKDIQKHREELLCSPLCVETLLACAFMKFIVHHFDSTAIEKEQQELTVFEPMMSDEQHFLYHYVCSIHPDFETRLMHLKKAGNYISCSPQRYMLGYRYYEKGFHDEALEYMNQAYSLACEEGNVHVMMDAVLIIGNCYCNNYNEKLMCHYYRIADRIARSLKKQDIHYTIQYNLGSTYLQWKQYDKAKAYLLASLHNEIFDQILTYQKLALVSFELNEHMEMKHYLEQADQLIDKEPSLSDMNDFVHCYCSNNIQEEHYLKLLEKLSSDTSFPYGFQKFYALYLFEAYMKRRRYKDALALSVKFRFDFPDKC
ncbi:MULTISPECIES: helix-turn-helix domain-containing protein [Bacillota]|jgi:tetratricopeptide (TPR) repeat protein|uniref:Helix-turn-helix domain-containing protein n=2 Tax=Amedibacillus TaxID=2749846 RepID=A0A7G9GSN7_9FIRM|nr:MULTISPECIES: helix-turn-helix domain-containing protein [Bacillota]QNM13819.1 helix-turn-helix domain-containing protein [[Eubacterium] hominis]MCH4283845.1 helix-turn-helix domain-containing protein [Amedibacillus hominis]RGB56732.1 XRE family transcriptional regulator [Absiella sp. AM22-9]RGB60827.1 XRE family transcriptional regulator [Absiella sp. AM10-20]RGB69147.1 XRE family transcriptional regulator [Absiella sp. AM09-45]